MAQIERKFVGIPQNLSPIVIPLCAQRTLRLLVFQDLTHSSVNHGNCLLRDASTLGRSIRSPRMTYRIKTRVTS